MFDDTTFNFSSFKLQSSEKINIQTFIEYLNIEQSNEIKRTHLFNGRYENIYIDKHAISTLISILDFANNCAKKTLDLEKELGIGFWFNDMPPGSITEPHTHDDNDELLSGVYYIKVPQHSGNLILNIKGNKKEITPHEGQLVLFRPNCLHEVTENKSKEKRLSIGMNFGIRKS